MKPYQGNTSGRFDPQQHIAKSYRPEVDGDEAKVVSHHRAARFARLGTKHQDPRPLVPRDDSGARRDGRGRFQHSGITVGWWLPKITEAMKRLFSGQ